jgi:hypothetical protein
MKKAATAVAPPSPADRPRKNFPKKLYGPNLLNQSTFSYCLAHELVRTLERTLFDFNFAL